MHPHKYVSIASDSDVDFVARLVSFRALKLTLLKRFRSLIFSNPIGDFKGPKALIIGEF